MSNIAIVYYSQGGATAMIAHSVAQGVIDAGAHADLYSLESHQVIDGRWQDPLTIERLANADAILFGAPTYTGEVAVPFKAFADATAEVWQARSWQGKLAGGFSLPAHAAGDQRLTLQYFALLAGQHGMDWAHWEGVQPDDGARRLGAVQGLVGQLADDDAAYALQPGDVIAGNLYGRHIAMLAARRGGEIIEPRAVVARRAREAAERRM